jgi:hypothetical protein
MVIQRARETFTIKVGKMTLTLNQYKSVGRRLDQLFEEVVRCAGVEDLAIVRYVVDVD